jgi:hypothetical protein
MAGGGKRARDERALAGPPGRQTLVLQLPEGLHHRVRVDRQLSGHVLNRGQRPDPAHARGGYLRVVAELLRHPARAAGGTELLHGDPDRLRHSVGAWRIRSLQAGREQRPAPGVVRGQLRKGELARPGGCRRVNDEGRGGHGLFVLLFLTLVLHRRGRGSHRRAAPARPGAAGPFSGCGRRAMGAIGHLADLAGMLAGRRLPGGRVTTRAVSWRTRGQCGHLARLQV